MTKFQVIQQVGLTRQLHYAELPPTPWLLDIQKSKLYLNDIQFYQILLSNRGIIKLQTQYSSELFLKNIPEFSIILPRLQPVLLDTSREYELSLFIERLQQIDLPEFFALQFNPLLDSKEYLQQLLALGPSIIVLGITPVDKSSAQKILPNILAYRSLIPSDVAIYLPGGAPLGIQSVLLSLGIDILDNSAAARLSMGNTRLSFGFARKAGKDHDYTATYEHNKIELEQEFDNYLQAITTGEIWSLIGRSMHVNPSVASFVKHYYNLDYPLSQIPLNINHPVYFIGDEDLKNPIVKNYYQRLQANYTFPATKVLILIPCSAKKPYSKSRSHRIYEKVINKALAGFRDLYEIWILTSPLGVVPRELETVYPARVYDIPVSGEWSAEETEITGNLLKSMLHQVPQDVQIVAHVSHDYSPMLQYINRELQISWNEEKPTSKAALQQLHSTLQAIAANLQREADKYHKNTKRIRTLRALLKWNFGSDFEVDLSHVQFTGYAPKPIQGKKNKIHWFSWDELRGSVKLSLAALETSNFKTNAYICFNDQILTGSTIFRPGIAYADESIAPQQEILIYNQDKSKLLGVGTALVAGTTMNPISSGPIIRIRKKYKEEGYKMEVAL